MLALAHRREEKAGAVVSASSRTVGGGTMTLGREVQPMQISALPFSRMEGGRGRRLPLSAVVQEVQMGAAACRVGMNGRERLE
jgi:hypothetical protein